MSYHGELVDGTWALTHNAETNRIPLAPGEEVLLRSDLVRRSSWRLVAASSGQLPLPLGPCCGAQSHHQRGLHGPCVLAHRVTLASLACVPWCTGPLFGGPVHWSTGASSSGMAMCIERGGSRTMALRTGPQVPAMQQRPGTPERSLVVQGLPCAPEHRGQQFKDGPVHRRVAQ